MKHEILIVVALAIATPAQAQLTGILKGVQKGVDTYNDLTFTDAEEQDLGSQISGKLRDKYGVVQDKNIHKYVALVGSLLAAESTRPNLSWTFVVLDTDGINAFAAPGGFIHITRGALALIQNEAQLAGVLGHEISHVTLKHTLSAIRKQKVVKIGANATGKEKVSAALETTYKFTLENAYDKGDEMAADEKGIALANKVGYAPGGLGSFLTTLGEHYKNQPDRSGLFASYPETKSRIDNITKLIASQKMDARALVVPRYGQSVPFKLAAATPAAGAPAASGGSKFGISNLTGVGPEKSNNQSVSSAGSRGVNKDRDAKGGPNKGAVAVTVTAVEIADFRKGIVG
jgi:predicted Zn-dependent protease